MRTHLDQQASSSLAAQVATAEYELRRAVDDLRELASGIHPTVLTDFGLAAAVTALAERETVPVRLVAVTEERFSSPAETTAFLVVTEAVKMGPVWVTIARCDANLVVEVEVAGEPPRLVDLEDRVGALDGTVGSEPTAAGVRIWAEIPCE